MAAALPSDWKLKGRSAELALCTICKNCTICTNCTIFTCTNCTNCTFCTNSTTLLNLHKVQSAQDLCWTSYMSLFIVHITHTPQPFQLRRLQKYDMNSLEISRLIREAVVQKLLAQLLQQEKNRRISAHHSKSTI